MNARRKAMDQGELFAGEPAPSAGPEGFVYRDDAVSEALMRDLVPQFAVLPFKLFEFHGFTGNRRIVSYGWRYDYSSAVLRESAPLPDFLLPLRQHAGEVARVSPEHFQQALVTEYTPGAGIGWHRDKPMFEDVVAFSFLAPCTLRFRRKQGDGWARFARRIAPRSAYLLRGPARFLWEHSIPPLDALRYSVTFRTFRAGDVLS